MSNQPTTTSQSDIAAFVEKANALASKSGHGRGRLIFALDATASRQPTWDMAAHVQTEMFLETAKQGGLSVQLVFYRGFQECKASRFVSDAKELLSLMQRVTCHAGRTQIGRVLQHALKTNSQSTVGALVFVGDACEEDVDHLGDLAGQMALQGTRAFLFQEGHNREASLAFSQIAKLTKGAHCTFQPGAAAELRELLGAVAAFASGGRTAVAKLPQSRNLRQLTQQLD